MKRITLSPRLLLVAVVTISIPASVATHAQNIRDMGYHGHFGIMAGINYNTLNSDPGRFILPRSLYSSPPVGISHCWKGL